MSKQADAKAQEAKAIKQECEEILAEAMPALNAAIQALDTIKAADIRLVQVRVTLMLAGMPSSYHGCHQALMDNVSL